MNTKTLTLAAAALSLAFALGPAAPALAQAPPAKADCSPVDGLSFICGVANVEDLVAEPSGRWVIGTAYTNPGVGLYVIDARARTAEPARLAIAPGAGAAPYAGCPAPDLAKLFTHGIELRPGRGGKHTLYVVNHGERESIEVFSLDVTGAEPDIRWVGCILPPAPIEANGIAILPGGALAVTKFRDVGDPEAFGRMMTGGITGATYLWKPGQGFTEVPGTRFSGDNGILASADGKQLFIADYGNKAIHRIALDGSSPPARVATDARPDNMRWTADGKILIAGQFVTEENRRGGLRGWTVDELDPRTMTLRRMVQKPGHAEYDNATTAVPASGQLWLGTFAGDRVAYLPIPKAR